MKNNKLSNFLFTLSRARSVRVSHIQLAFICQLVKWLAKKRLPKLMISIKKKIEREFFFVSFCHNLYPINFLFYVGLLQYLLAGSVTPSFIIIDLFAFRFVSFEYSLCKLTVLLQRGNQQSITSFRKMRTSKFSRLHFEHEKTQQNNERD